MATEKTEKADKDPAAKAIKGEVAPNQSVIDQAKKARGEEPNKPDDGGKVNSGAKSAAEKATTPEMELRDAAKKAKEEHLESLGLDKETASNPGSGIHKVENAETKEPMYQGVVTVTGVDGQYHKKISTRIDTGPEARGLAWLKYAFKQHFPSVDLNAEIEVDPKNESDPLLRSQYG
jgi:hypothetical protein